jgi:hypothetical protein
MENTFAPS